MVLFFWGVVDVLPIGGREADRKLADRGLFKGGFLCAYIAAVRDDYPLFDIASHWC